MDSCNLYIQPSRYKVIDNFFFGGDDFFFISQILFNFFNNISFLLHHQNLKKKFKIMLLHIVQVSNQDIQ
jgi:hypothetical protein